MKLDYMSTVLIVNYKSARLCVCKYRLAGDQSENIAGDQFVYLRNISYSSTEWSDELIFYDEDELCIHNELVLFMKEMENYDE